MCWFVGVDDLTGALHVLVCNSLPASTACQPEIQLEVSMRSPWKLQSAQAGCPPFHFRRNYLVSGHHRQMPPLADLSYQPAVTPTLSFTSVVTCNVTFSLLLYWSENY